MAWFIGTSRFGGVQLRRLHTNMSTKAAGTTSMTPKIEAQQKLTASPKGTEPEKVPEAPKATDPAKVTEQGKPEEDTKPKKKGPPTTAAGRLCVGLRADLAAIKRPIDLVKVEEEAVSRLRNVALEALATCEWSEIMPAVRKRIMEFVPLRLKELEKKGRKALAWDGVLKITDARIVELVGKLPAAVEGS